MRTPTPVTGLALAAFVLAATSACGGGKGGPRTSVTATDEACTLSSTQLKVGNNTFAIANKGKSTTEVYVYARSGGKFNRIVEENEHIGPGTSATIEARLKPGTYEVACKPGEKGDGIRTRISVR